MKTRLFTSIFFSIALIASLATQAQPAKAAPTQIRIYVGLGTGTDEQQRIDQDALAKAWNDNHSDIQITFQYNDYATARDVLLTQVAANTPPDIVGPVGIGGLNSTGDLWADLTTYIAQDKAELNMSDFDAATLNLYELNGKDIAIPLGIYPSFMFVNKDIFDAAQVALPPTDYNNGQPQYEGKVWDMEALRQVAIKLTQDSNGRYADEQEFDPTKIMIYGFADTLIDMRGWAQLFSPGHAGVAPDGKTAIFNEKTYVQAMQWRHDSIFKDHISPDLAAQTALNTNVANPFASGKIAMLYSHTWAMDGIKDVKFKWVAGVAPVAPNGKLTARINADTFAILDKSPNKDAAWKVLKWLNSPEIAAKACAIYGCLPARISARSAWETQIKTDYPLLDLNVVYGAIPYLDVPNSEAAMPNYNQAFDTFSAFFSALDTDPNLDVPSELDKLNTQMQAVFDGKVPLPAATEAGSK
jgi:multiple sugar transport system substrate-binding protein